MAFTIDFPLVYDVSTQKTEYSKLDFNDHVKKAGVCGVYGTPYTVYGLGQCTNLIFCLCVQYDKQITVSRISDLVNTYYYSYNNIDWTSRPAYITRNFEYVDSVNGVACAFFEVRMYGGAGAVRAIVRATEVQSMPLTQVYYGANYTNFEPALDYNTGILTFCLSFLASLGKPKYEDDKSEPQGGGGSYSDTSEDIILDSLDSINNKSILRTSFISQYWLSQTQLTALSNEFWSDNMLTQIKKMFAEPMDAIVSLSLLPVVPDITENVAVIVGRYRTNITAPIVFKQFVEVDCGQLDLKEFWGTALDYSPNTTLEIFLPYIGTRTINIDDVQASTIKLKYRIDTVTGQCVAFLSRVKDDVDNILYTWDGNCAYNISLSAQNFTSAYQSMLQSAGALGVGLVTGNAGLGMVTGAISSLTASAKPTISRGGSMNGTNGILGYKTPYLIITRPIQSYPADFETFKGYPSNISAKLGDLSGFTKVNTIHLENITATEKELEEIERLLKAGVIL